MDKYLPIMVDLVPTKGVTFFNISTMIGVIKHMGVLKWKSTY